MLSLSNRRRSRAAMVAVAALGALLMLAGPYLADAQTIRLLTTGLLFAYLAQCWNLAGGYAGLFSLAHPVYFAIGGYTSTLLLVEASITPWLGMLIGAVLAAVVGGGLTAVTVRFQVSGIYFALLTLAFWTVATALVSAAAFLGRASGLLLPLSGSPSMLDFLDPYGFYVVILVLVLALAVGTRLFAGSVLGRAVVAQREDPLAAEASGVRTGRVKIIAMSVSAGATALGGTFAAQYYHFASPETLLSFDVTLQMLLGTLVGGPGTVLGPIVGGLGFHVFAEVLRGIPVLSEGSRGGVFTTIIYAALLIVTTLLAPKGLLPALIARLRRGRDASLLSSPSADSRSSKPIPVVRTRPRTSAQLSSGTALLEAKGLSKQIGGLRAVDQVSLSVSAGEVLGVIGPNGAGKTTLFNCLSGFMRPTAGDVYLAGERVTGMAPSALCHLGMARTFQVTKPFPDLTVVDAVQVALDQRRVPDDSLSADDILDMVAFKASRRMRGADTSVVNRKRLELARALATGPEVILLDEVCAGLAHAEVDELVAVLQAIQQSGVALVMVEHVLPAVFALAEEVLVIAGGRVLTLGTPDEVMTDPHVISAYLGSAAEDLDIGGRELPQLREDGVKVEGAS